MKKFLETISGLVGLPPQCEAELLSIAKFREVAKGEIILKVNSVSSSAYYIEQGLTRTFYYKDGKDVTDWISTEGEFAISIISFLSNLPDRRGIEALEAGVLYELQRTDLELLYHKYHEIERLGRLLVSQGIIQLQQRFDELHFSTARERYQELMAEKPAFIQRVPLGILASFLGMSQETLSRIRAQI